MKKLSFVLLLATITGLYACSNEPKEDVTNSVNKEGAIETSVTVQHLDSLQDVLVTEHRIWKNNLLIKSVSYRDTVAALGVQNSVAENKDGDTKTVAVKKDYEIFITVK